MSPAALADYGTCDTCGAPMRAARSYGSIQVGTRPRKCEGQCQACYRAARRAAENTPAHAGADPAAAEERRDRENAQALQAWLQWRRNRGVPENGWNAA